MKKTGQPVRSGHLLAESDGGRDVWTARRRRGPLAAAPGGEEPARHRPTLLVQGLDVVLGGRRVVSSVSLELGPATTVAVTGPSGSGKTTLLHALAGLQTADAGHVRALGHDLAELEIEELSALRLAHYGFVFQSADLVPELSIRENVALPLELAGARRSEVRSRVDALLDELDLQECARRRPDEVSGGQAQRAAVARAVVARPAIVLADEPTGALDTANRDVVLDLLLDQVATCGALLVLVTHDAEVAARCEHQVAMLDGRAAPLVGAARA